MNKNRLENQEKYDFDSMMHGVINKNRVSSRCSKTPALKVETQADGMAGGFGDPRHHPALKENTGKRNDHDVE
jgi:hypothetical protein